MNIAYRGDLNDLPACAKLPALRSFTRLESMGREELSPWRDSYVRYARQDKKRQVSLVKDGEENLPVMLRLNMITAGALPEIRALLENRRNVEQMALLLEYEQRMPKYRKRSAEEAADLGFERQLAQMSRSADRKANARGSAKVRKAQDLGIEIKSEDEFIQMALSKETDQGERS